MAAWPTELRVDPSRSTLSITFEDGQSFVLPAEYLRVESPSAEVQGHSAAQKQIVGGREGAFAPLAGNEKLLEGREERTV